MWQSWQSKGVATRQRRARQKFLGGCCRLYNCLPPAHPRGGKRGSKRPAAYVLCPPQPDTSITVRARTVRRSGNQGIGAQQLHSQNTFVLPTTTDISLAVDLQFAFSTADPPFAGCQLFQTIHQSCLSGRSYFYHRLSGRSCLLFASVCTFNLLWRP